MTPEEFKSWFAGFTEALAGPPSDEQWKRICEQVQRIQARPTVSLRDDVTKRWATTPTRDANFFSVRGVSSDRAGLIEAEDAKPYVVKW